MKPLNEVAIIRGGWSDGNGNEFSEDLKPDTLCGLTVLFTSPTNQVAEAFKNVFKNKK